MDPVNDDGETGHESLGEDLDVTTYEKKQKIKNYGTVFS